MFITDTVKLSLEKKWELLVQTLDNVKKEWMEFNTIFEFEPSVKMEIGIRLIVIGEFILKNKGTNENLLALANLSVPLIEKVKKTYHENNINDSPYEDQVKMAQRVFPNPNQTEKIIKAFQDPEILSKMQAAYYAKKKN